MKYFIAYILLLMVSCNTVTTDQNPEGVYTSKYQNEFAKTQDTLFLKSINNNYYKVERHTGVTRKAGTKAKTAKKVLIEKWTFEYDKDKKSLTELKTGKTLIWNPDKNVLLLGSREYVKI